MVAQTGAVIPQVARMPKVSVVIVCMNRPDILFPCLDSIRRYTTVEYETLVVAYMFSAENLQSLKSSYPWVTVIESKELRGFAENNNLALRQAKGEYCFVVNDDTYMDMPVIDRLVDDFARLPGDAAAVTPALYFPAGERQSCGMEPFTPFRYVRHYLGLVDTAKPTKWTWQDGLFPTCTLNGACFLIRTQAFRDAGWFDETYMFTPEDVALGMLLRKMGYSIWADSDTRITHIANATASALQAAIKPARVRGSLIYYSSFRHLASPQGTGHINKLVYAALGAFVWTYEALRGVKYGLKKRFGHLSERDVIMRRTARNVRRTVFSSKMPKELFIQYRDELN